MYWSSMVDLVWILINNQNNQLSCEIGEIYCMCLELNVSPREMFPVQLHGFKTGVAPRGYT